MTARSTPSVRFLRHILLPVVAGLLAAVLFVACEALPTDPAMEAETSIADAERTDGTAGVSTVPSGMQVSSGSMTSPFMCVLSTRTDAASAGAMGPAYTYRYVGLAFDAQLVAAAQGEMVTLTYRLRDERGQIARQATCRLPENLQAQALLSAWLFPQGSVGQGERLQFVRENMPGLFTTWDDLFGEPCTSACDEGQDCVWTPYDDLPDGLFCYTGGICYPVDGGNDEEENEPIDIPGGGGGEGCSPFDCPPDAPGDGDDDLPPAGVPPPPPPSDDCPEDDDDTPAPPEGGDEPCDFDCWEPPDDDDDPFNPPGFMSVQSWQTTSSGMAVAVYQPASADCPGDDDPENPCESEDPPAYCDEAGSCFDADIQNEEHHDILKALESSGHLSAMWDRSADFGLESFNWIEQDPTTGDISSRPLEGDEGNTLPCAVLTYPDAAPENAIGYVHTHPKIGETRSCRVDPKNLSKGYIEFEYTESHVSQDDLDTVILHDLDFGIMLDSEAVSLYDSTEIRGAYPRCVF